MTLRAPVGDRWSRSANIRYVGLRDPMSCSRPASALQLLRWEGRLHPIKLTVRQLRQLFAECQDRTSAICQKPRLALCTPLIADTGNTSPSIPSEISNPFPSSEESCKPSVPAQHHGAVDPAAHILTQGTAIRSLMRNLGGSHFRNNLAR